MKKIRFGFVGVGRRGMTHLQVSRSIKEISVAALCDIDEKRVRTLAKSYKAKAYTDLKDMLENEDLDVAVISTPTRYHVSHAMACLSRGLHILMEKPISLRLNEAKRLYDAVRKTDRIVLVGFQARYSNVVNWIKRVIDKDTLSMVAGFWYWTVPLVRWVADRRYGGGQIIDQVIHLIDLARFLVEDEVEKVYAIYTEKGRGTEEDKRLGFNNWASYSVNFRFKNGVIGNLYSTYALYPRIFDVNGSRFGYPVCLDIICRERLIRYFHMERALMFRRGYDVETCRLTGNPTVNMYKSFVNAIVKGDKSSVRTLYEDSFKSMVVALAANKSAETGETVSVAEFVDQF